MEGIVVVVRGGERRCGESATSAVPSQITEALFGDICTGGCSAANLIAIAQLILFASARFSAGASQYMSHIWHI